MPTHVQMLAKLFWETACDGLRSAIDPGPTDPPRATDGLAQACLLAYRALNALGHAFDLSLYLKQALDLISTGLTELHTCSSENVA